MKLGMRSGNLGDAYNNIAKSPKRWKVEILKIDNSDFVTDDDVTS